MMGEEGYIVPEVGRPYKLAKYGDFIYLGVARDSAEEKHFVFRGQTGLRLLSRDEWYSLEWKDRVIAL